MTVLPAQYRLLQSIEYQYGGVPTVWLCEAERTQSISLSISFNTALLPDARTDAMQWRR